MRGRVLAVAGASAAGIIASEDGRRYSYGLPDLRSAAPQAGQDVDFQPGADEAREVYLIPGSMPVVVQGPKRDWVAFYMSPNGRVGRSDYWLYGFLVLMAVNVVVGWIPLIGQVVSLVAAWSGLALMIKRCHDVDRSGWWGFLPLVPLLLAVVGGIVAALATNGAPGYAVAGVFGLLWFGASIWVVVAILARRGDAGPNRFGPPPVTEL
ncbi:DUF805 domain-containing protein [Methylobacterium trifolii]